MLCLEYLGRNARRSIGACLNTEPLGNKCQVFLVKFVWSGREINTSAMVRWLVGVVGLTWGW